MFLLLLIRTTEESSPRVKPKFKTDTKFKDSERSSRLGEVTPDPKRKFSKPKAKFPKSTDKVNVWSKQEKAKAKERKRAPCWLVVFVFCCGVSKEHQWYSLLGKGERVLFFDHEECVLISPYSITLESNIRVKTLGNEKTGSDHQLRKFLIVKSNSPRQYIGGSVKRAL